METQPGIYHQVGIRIFIEFNPQTSPYRRVNAVNPIVLIGEGLKIDKANTAQKAVSGDVKSVLSFCVQHMFPAKAR
jgi:hypothetical protein